METNEVKRALFNKDLKQVKTASVLKWMETNEVKRTLFNETKQYNVHIFDKTIFLKYWTRQIKATETNK